jgi:O-antigen ligase
VRWINRLYLPLGMLAVLLKASRSALLLTGLALLIVPWTLPRLGFGMRIAMVGILAVSVAGAIRYTPAASLARLATTRAELAQGDFNTRRPVWRAGVKLLPRQPVGGVGAGAFPVRSCRSSAIGKLHTTPTCPC